SSEPRPRPAAFFSGDLPEDALYEVLLRIPAKELCRLRAVCPSWRALTSDPLFVVAHMSRHRTAPPLLAMGYRDDSGVNGVEISDLSGNVVKRIPSAGYEIVLVDGLSGVAGGRMSSKDDTIRVEWCCGVEWCAFGQVSSTREYKALRVSDIGDRKVCEVITFDATNHGRWRKQDPPSAHIFASLKMRSLKCVVVDGVLSLAELNGCLVMVHNIHKVSMDLWFLTDFEKGTWCKKYSMPSHVARFGNPFLMLDDGRIFFKHGEGFLQSYDPRNGTYTMH
uniref:F-box domain-containing protein n=1 Tax=Aegilops tauschii subsp. strangulata TaxID=200361 RepID=A0A453LG48_AEGTS